MFKNLGGASELDMRNGSAIVHSCSMAYIALYYSVHILWCTQTKGVF